MKNCLDFRHTPRENIIDKSNIALARATNAVDSIYTIVSRWLGLGNSWCISVAVRNACCLETPRLELKSSQTFIAIKHCPRPREPLCKGVDEATVNGFKQNQ